MKCNIIFMDSLHEMLALNPGAAKIYKLEAIFFSFFLTKNEIQLLAVKICCKNRFDHCTLFICFAHLILGGNRRRTSNTIYRAVTVSEPKIQFVDCLVLSK